MQYVDPILRGPINPQYIFQYLESCWQMAERTPSGSAATAPIRPKIDPKMHETATVRETPAEGRLYRETAHFFMVSMASKRGEARLRRSVRALLDLTSSEARTGGAFAQPSPTDPNPEPILPTPAMALPLFPPAARPCFAATQHLQSEIDHDTTPWVPLRTPVPVPMQSVA